MHIDRLIRCQRKTIALIVERDGSLVARAPLRASRSQTQGESRILDLGRVL